MSLSPVLLRKVELALHEILSGDPSTADQLIKGLKTIDHGQEISEREYERIRLIGAIRQGQPAQALMIWNRLHAAFSIDPSALMGDLQALHVTAPNEVRQFMETLQEGPVVEQVEVDSEQAASPLAWATNVPWGRVGFGTVIAAVAMIAVVIANIGRDDEVGGFNQEQFFTHEWLKKHRELLSQVWPALGVIQPFRDCVLEAGLLGVPALSGLILERPEIDILPVKWLRLLAILYLFIR